MLAIFDLDDTLISGDSAHLFTAFLIEQGLHPDPKATEKDTLFLKHYQSGRLNLKEYMKFSLLPIKGWSKEQVNSVVNGFIDEVIRPRICPAMRQRLDWHRQQQHRLLIISATGEHLVLPIAEALGVPDALGIEVLWRDSALTGEIGARRPFQAGKLEALKQWLSVQTTPLGTTWFYSDSHNDLPLLEQVDHPVAVNPDPQLLARAQTAGWTILEGARL
ncbi:MAG: HAD family hydrolase [Gammaproteobacteria bacterium]|uniref:Haloacid dehalogenase-like hydrolase n=1 Tax=Marinobacter litoralis TaxID=187981 RepID=A0A3M2R8L8_9GAMM|nr:HAD family hydrolase [Marinobacter litoralis]MBR9871671.1 HAD family hydrolase [Gammaproteobacteria bacterium]RMJ01581.1 haloacid dehalogenase-like hydrolase [Marinobacter litoralis]